MIKRRNNFDKYLLDNITLHICCLNAIAFICQSVGLSVYEKLAFSPSLILQGEVWRAITFLFIPGTGSVFFTLLMLYFYYILGSALESNWGKGKYNLYLLCLIIFTVIAGFISNASISNAYIFTSLLLAFAYMWPNEEFLLFFILPIKAKWLAYFELFGYALLFIFGTTMSRLAIVAILMPLVIFFGRDMVRKIKAYIRRKKYERR